MAALPLSFDQERMWLFDRLLEASVSYDEPAVIRLRGPFNPAALAAAWTQVTTRHEGLRTRFPVDDGTPSQLIDPAARTPIALVDLSNLGPVPARREMLAMVAAESTRPFDLETGPLCRMLVMRNGFDDHMLAITVHHLAADLWSMALVFEELVAVYTAAIAGRPPRLPEITVQPADIGRKARERLTPHRLAALRSMWRNRLAGVKPVALPSDHPRPIRPNLGAHLHVTTLEASLSDELRRFGPTEGATLFVVVLAALQALLTRWTDGEDLVVVSVAAGRRGRHAERVIGMLTECLVLRVNAAGDPTVRDLLARAREATLDAFDGSDLPFAEIVAIVDPGRDLEPSPLRQFGLSVHNLPHSPLVLPGIALEGMAGPRSEISIGISEADLWLEVYDDGANPLSLRLQMDNQMFDASSLPLTVHRLSAVLHAMVTQPTARLSELSGVDGDGHRWFPRAGTGEADQPTVPALPKAVDESTVVGVAQVVAGVLGVDTVSAKDNFFLLGGVSMDAARLTERLRRRFAVRVGLYDVCVARTVVEIARVVDAADPL
jgi:hypothetical protein